MSRLEDSTRFDVCIIGAGATGLFAASRLRQRGLRVVILEAGASGPLTVDQGLPASRPHQGIDRGWASGLGGSTQLWGGQLWEWRKGEFGAIFGDQAGAGILEYESLATGYQAVRDELRLGRGHSLVQNGTLDRSISDSLTLRYSTWLNYAKRNLGKTIGRRLQHDRGVSLELNTRATSLSFNGNAVGHVNASLPDGSQKRFTANSYILAAGTLGNVSLLNDSVLPLELPWLGRGFMDHVSGRYGEIETEDVGALLDSMGPRYVSGVRCTPRVVKVSEFGRTGVGAFAHLEIEMPMTSPLRTLRQSLRNAQHSGIGVESARSAMSTFPSLVTLAFETARYKRFPAVPGARYFLRVDTEQPPRPESKVGRPVDHPAGTLRLHWSIGQEEYASFDECGSTVADWLSHRGHEVVECRSPVLEDSFHMMGGMRIGDGADNSVVDHSMKLHGVGNVFAVGPCTFPRSALANPTMTAMAMCEPLAAKLRMLSGPTEKG